MPEETGLAASIEQEAPAVHVGHTRNTPGAVLTEIALGLEEEGIPVRFFSVGPGSSRSASKEAAMASRLNVGIGLDWDHRRVALHHRDLPLEEPLFDLDGSEDGRDSFRRLGANAARLVKGDPLMLDRPEDGSWPEKPDLFRKAAPEPQDPVSDLVKRVLKALNVQP